ncbi:MAG: glycerol-3-phosphate acyltransferase [Acidimicrobiales bacterium]
MPGALAVTVVVAYLLGSVPVAVLVARARGVDPRRSGDGNPGYWNVKELLGRRAALPVFAGDALKGVLGALAGVAAGQLAGVDAHDRMVLAWTGTAAAMVGHAWPVFARFKGGRSILTFAGGLAVWSPRGFGLSICALLVVWALTRSFAWGTRVGVFTTPFAVLVVDGLWRTAALGLLLSLIGLRFALAGRGGSGGPASCGPDGSHPRSDDPPPERR